LKTEREFSATQEGSNGKNTMEPIIIILGEFWLAIMQIIAPDASPAR
jgi:hypothetical protein